MSIGKHHRIVSKNDLKVKSLYLKFKLKFMFPVGENLIEMDPILVLKWHSIDHFELKISGTYLESSLLL